MQALDLVFMVLLCLLLLRGFLKGFTGEFFSIASLVLALTAAVFLYKNGAVFLRIRFIQKPLGGTFVPEIISFLAIFGIVFIAGKIIEHIVKDIISRLNLDTLDKVLGLFLGLAEAFVLIILVLFLLQIQPLFDPSQLLGKSLFARLFLPLFRSPGLLEVLRV